MTTPPVLWEGMTTPPIPSSSPAGTDCMDYSPLPHKAPFALSTKIIVQPPIRTVSTAIDEDMLSPCELPPPNAKEAPCQPPVVEYVFQDIG